MGALGASIAVALPITWLSCLTGQNLADAAANRTVHWCLLHVDSIA
jgi:hypothetical protein